MKKRRSAALLFLIKFSRKQAVCQLPGLLKKRLQPGHAPGKHPYSAKLPFCAPERRTEGPQKAAAQHKAFGVLQRLAILPAASIAFRLRVCYNNLYIVKKQGEPEMEEQKKRILSGIQPTGTFTLGNYVGAVRNWDALQSDYNCIYMIANMHAITVRQTPADLRRQTREAAALLLACGIDPDRSVLFVQSHVPAHAELSWVLSCSTPFGELTRMHQFKEKSARHPEDINAGLFTYPVLMAADILIYNADLVPVGQDQTQHLEIARDIAGRFNGIYGDTFTLPEGYVPAAGAKIMSLAEPTKKMSKSDTNINSFILMTDDKDAIVRKFKRAVTDSDGVVRFDRETKPGVSNLMCIYSTFTGKSNDEIAAEFEGKGYGDFKLAVAEVTADALAPVQAEYARILADKAYVDEVLKNGAERASRLANRTVSKVYRKVGLLQLDK